MTSTDQPKTLDEWRARHVKPKRLWTAHAQETGPDQIVVDLVIEQTVNDVLAPLAQFERKDDMASTEATSFAERFGVRLRPTPVKEAPAPVESKADRPESVVQMIGQDKLRAKLLGRVRAATLLGEEMPHSLLFGPPGCGKTSLAKLIAIETGGRLVETIADALESPRALVQLFAELKDGDVLFVDEIHGMTKRVQRTFYKVMEDGVLEVPVGTGSTATVERQPIRRVVIVGATTDPGKLPQPLLDRFPFKGAVEYYSDDELAQVIAGAAANATPAPIKIGDEEALDLARRSRGTPRVAKDLLHTAYRFAVADAGDIDVPVTSAVIDLAMEFEEIDEAGLTKADRDLLSMMCKTHKGGPVGLENLAASLGIDNRTLDKMIEPFLIRCKFIVRRSSGRIVTDRGWHHLGLNPPATAPKADELELGV